MAKKIKTAEYYRQLPYSRRVSFVEEDNGEAYFVASIVELDGVEADGATPNEALANLSEAFVDYLAAMLQWGAVIPEPVCWPESLGWSVQVPSRSDSVSLGAFEPEVPNEGDPRSQTRWIDEVPSEATARTTVGVS